MTAPATGRTADENEMREQIAKTIYEAFPIYCDNPRPKCAVWPWHVPPSATSHDRYYALADRLLSGPLAPILQEAAHLRAENANLRDRVREAEKGAEAMRERCAREAERVVKVPAKTIGGMRIERLPIAPRTPREVAAAIRALSLTAQHEEAADA